MTEPLYLTRAFRDPDGDAFQRIHHEALPVDPTEIDEVGFLHPAGAGRTVLAVTLFDGTTWLGDVLTSESPDPEAE